MCSSCLPRDLVRHEIQAILSLGVELKCNARLGRDFTPTFWNDAVFDFFNATGVGTSVISQARSSSTAPGRMPFTADFGANNPTYIRASNSVGYLLPPTLNGFYGERPRTRMLYLRARLGA